MTRDELRTLFIESGLTLLREEGLAAIGEVLTFKNVRERVEADTGIRVTNASLIGRAWDSQFDFQTDVLATIAANDSGSEIARTVQGLVPVLLSMDPSSLESRRRTMREVARLTAAANTSVLNQSTDWLLWIGIWAMTAVGVAPERRRRIDSALEQAYLAMTDRMEAIYQAGLDYVGYRIRDGLTVNHFTIAVAALAEGCALRNRVDATRMRGIMRPTGPNGEEQEWTLFGLALDALAEQFFEVDPDWVPPPTEGPTVPDVLDH